MAHHLTATRRVLLDDAERAAEEPAEQAVRPNESEEPGTTPEEAHG